MARGAAQGIVSQAAMGLRAQRRGVASQAAIGLQGGRGASGVRGRAWGRRGEQTYLMRDNAPLVARMGLGETLANFFQDRFWGFRWEVHGPSQGVRTLRWA